MPHIINGARITDAAAQRCPDLLGGCWLCAVPRNKVDRTLRRHAAASPSPVRCRSAGAGALADEPTGNLDTRTAADIFVMLRAFSRDFGTSFLIVTHDPRLAATRDRQVTLADNQIVADEH